MREVLAPPAERPVAPGPVPTFSVIMAAYQAAETIGEAIESALAQTAPPHEIVVCDDGSTDDLDGALEPYRDGIVLIRKENGGEASAKNAAARAATGDFAVLLDADDAFMPERLEALGELAAARPDLDILTTDAVIEKDGRPLRQIYRSDFPFEVTDQRRAILQRNFVFGLAAVRRERLVADGGFDESIRFTADWERWIRLILDGARAGCCPEPLARYRLTHGSLSSQIEQMLDGRIVTLAKAAERRGLSDAEREAVRRTLEADRREVIVVRAREAVVDGRPDARRLSLAAMRAPGMSARTRLKCALAALSPRAGRLALGRRPRETTAGILLPAD